MTGRASAPILPFFICCAGVALFSVMDAVMKGLSLAIGVYNALLWRSIAGTLMGGALMLTLRRPRPSAAVMRLHAVRGIVVAAMVYLFFIGITRLPLAEAIALSFIAPIIALYLAALLLKEEIGRNAVLASLVALAGVGVILSGRLRGSYDGEALTGAIAVLASAMLFAWNLILQRQQAQRSSPVEVAFYQQLVLMLLFGLAAPFLAILPAARHAPMIMAGAALAFVSLALLSWAYARAEAQRLIPVEYSAFVWAAIMGWLFFQEPVTPTTLAGAALIVTGCLIAARRGTGTPPHVEGAIA